MSPNSCERKFRRLQKKLYLTLLRIRAVPSPSRRLKLLGGYELNRIIDSLRNLCDYYDYYESMALFLIDTLDVISQYMKGLIVQCDIQRRRKLIMLAINNCKGTSNIMSQVRRELRTLLSQVGDCPIQEIRTILINVSLSTLNEHI